MEKKRNNKEVGEKTNNNSIEAILVRNHGHVISNLMAFHLISPVPCVSRFPSHLKQVEQILLQLKQSITLMESRYNALRSQVE